MVWDDFCVASTSTSRMVEWEKDNLAMVGTQEIAYIALAFWISSTASVAVPKLKHKKAMAFMQPTGNGKAAPAIMVLSLSLSFSEDNDTDTADKEYGTQYPLESQAVWLLS